MDGNLPQGPLAFAGRFGQHYNNNNLVVVEMGDVGIVDFSVCGAIGTYGLNGCSVALVASPYAVILAHIPPRPDLINADPHSGDNNTRNIMVSFAQLYETYVNFFPDGDSHIICAVFQNESKPPVPEHVAIIEAEFWAMGLVPEVHYYEIPVYQNRIGQGTVVVVSNGPGLAPTVFAEDSPL